MIGNVDLSKRCAPANLGVEVCGPIIVADIRESWVRRAVRDILECYFSGVVLLGFLVPKFHLGMHIDDNYEVRCQCACRYKCATCVDSLALVCLTRIGNAVFAIYRDGEQITFVWRHKSNQKVAFGYITGTVVLFR